MFVYYHTYIAFFHMVFYIFLLQRRAHNDCLCSLLLNLYCTYNLYLFLCIYESLYRRLLRSCHQTRLLMEISYVAVCFTLLHCLIKCNVVSTSCILCQSCFSLIYQLHASAFLLGDILDGIFLSVRFAKMPF